MCYTRQIKSRILPYGNRLLIDNKISMKLLGNCMNSALRK